ncbi:MAG: CRISPR-associated helicase Cas3', partial [Thermodesulfovibrio sp.]|nr:CRISPR-associated helicase Cas3' [Thermodesulfovibrio sp.]
MRVFAKSDKKTTLRKHTEDLFTVLNHIKKYIPEQIIDALKISVFFHDLGKVMPSFQIKEMDNKNYEPWDVTYEIPHSLFSVFLIDLDKLKNEYKNFIISAIAYHHWREDYEKYLKSRDIEFAEFCKKAIEWKDKLINNLLNEMSNLEAYSKFITVNESWLNGIINGRSLTRYAVPPYKFDYEPLREGPNKDWILLSGFLQRCDHFASYCEEEGENFDNVEIESILFDKLKKGIELDIKSKIKKEEKIWQFEKFEEAKGKNIVLVAPTGYGKTEFAFLWSHSKKFVYTLPLRSAVNQIFNRAENLFGNDKVGILYSDIDLYLITKKSEEEAFRTYGLSRQLSYPVIISTGDQFFPYALRPPGFEKIFSLFSYSDIVIDEVQAYEPKACAIVVKFLRWINFLGGRFLVMTATLPNFIMDAIKKDLEIHCINIYEEKKQDLSKIFKHKLGIIEIQNAEGSFEITIEIIKAMINQASSGKRVLIILNTVEQAQKVYEAVIEQIKKDNINIKVYLLHSRFTINDRKKLEYEIFKEFSNPKPNNEGEGKILIATQVVEASLDIDADIIYTEICPLDSLVQRMGRVLRRYFYIGDGKIIDKSNEEEININ